MKQVEALILTGYGINCNLEMEQACKLAGARVTVIHTSALFSASFEWNKFSLLVFPGGFSFGDELGAGKALANRLSYNANHLRDRLFNFVEKGGAILGVCNGFQLLVKLGLLPAIESDLNQSVSLAPNHTGCFECRWVDHRVLSSRCIFTQGLQSIYLPIRHGEGKFVAANDEIIQALFERGLVPLQYAQKNPNGSMQSIAGVCDPTGRVLGMMAHPEAAVFFTQHPHWIRKKEELKLEHKPIPTYGDGLALFKNAIHYLEEGVR